MAATSPLPGNGGGGDGGGGDGSEFAASAGHVWYASFGSMMNTTALRLRGIEPKRSLWCEIAGYRRMFYAVSGVATLQAEGNGAVTHAVAHEITQDELAELQKREPPVLWVRARLRLKGLLSAEVPVAAFIAKGVLLEGISVEAPAKAGDFVRQSDSGAVGQLSAPLACGEVDPVVLVWQSAFDTTGPVTIDGRQAGTPTAMRTACLEPALPTARYVDIMLEGAVQAGMDAAEVAKLAALPCVPRKTLEQLGRFPSKPSEELRAYTEEEVRGLLDHVIFCGKVLRGPGACFKWEPGTDVGLFFSRQFYDPKYGIPPSSVDEPWDGWPAIEDRALEIHLQEFVQVGWLSKPGAKRRRCDPDPVVAPEKGACNG